MWSRSRILAIVAAFSPVRNLALILGVWFTTGKILPGPPSIVVAALCDQESIRFDAIHKAMFAIKTS